MKASKGRSKGKQKQSNLSKALASSNKIGIVQKRFFDNLNSGEIRRSVPTLVRHRHFTKALAPNRQGYKHIYAAHTPIIPLEKCLSWCLGLLEVQRQSIEIFIPAQERLLEHLLARQFDAALDVINTVEEATGVSAWSVSLHGTLLTMVRPDERHAYISSIITSAADNGFFKSLTYHLTNRFDDPETLLSESRFFELTVKRSFVGRLLHFLMYKLVPYNVEFNYDFEEILNFEKDSSPIDIYCCLLDFIAFHINTDNAEMRELCKRVITDLRRQFSHSALDDLAIAYGLDRPTPIEAQPLKCIDLYTAGNYSAVCDIMDEFPKLSIHFGLIEIWAKSLARIPTRIPKYLQHILTPLQDIVTKSVNYEKSRALLLAYCHALSMFKWFRELRHLLERETHFYSNEVNERIRDYSFLISSLSTPAKIQALVARGLIGATEAENLVPSSSVTALLYKRMRSSDETLIEDDGLLQIEEARRRKFQAGWFISRGRYLEAVPLLEGLVNSVDHRISQDASRSLVEAYRSIGDIERAAAVYVDAVLANSHLLSVFDTRGLCQACKEILTASTSVAMTIVLSLHSRFIGDSFDAALKYGFECYLKNNQLQSPSDLLPKIKELDAKMLYFLRYVCIPEVMKLYLFFDSPQQIEQCRIEICRALLNRFDGDEDLVFEIKDRTRRLIARDAATQVHSSRIYSDANFLTGSATAAFRALFERHTQLRLIDFSQWEDEKILRKVQGLFRDEPKLIGSAHTIHVQDLVLNEKNSVFLKLIKLIRDEFVFGEKGLNVYLSTRIRHGHFPNTLRKPLLDNSLLATKSTDTAGYKLSKDAINNLKLPENTIDTIEASLVEFNGEFNKLIDEVNDHWLRIFTIDQDLSGLGKDAEIKKSLFNYSVTAVESYHLEQELPPGASYQDFVSLVSKWLWARTEQNLELIRTRIATEACQKTLDMLEELGRSATQKFGIYNLGSFPDALARTRNGLVQAFEVVEGWFTRARGANIKSFELFVPVQIASTALDLSIHLDDDSGITWSGTTLNPLVDAFYILFENAVSKSCLEKNSLNIRVQAKITDEALSISITNRCAYVSDLQSANAVLDRYRSAGESRKVVHAAQGEGGSGFFKVWRLLLKDMSVRADLSMGFFSSDSFQVSITIPHADFEKVFTNADTTRRR